MNSRTYGLGGIAVLTLALWLSPALAAPATIGGSSKINLRGGPGPDYGSVAIVPDGEGVEVVERKGSWFLVRLIDGRSGFVHASYVTMKEAVAAPAFAAAPAVAANPPAAAPAAPTAAERAPSEGANALVATELAGLRAEVAELRRKIEERMTENETPRSPATPLVIPTTPRTGGADNGAPSGDPAVNLVAVAAIALSVGWVSGVSFGRRRGRNQRSRLRF